MLPRHDSGDEAVIAAFLQQVCRDHGAGIVRDVPEYQRRFPGHEALIAAEHARLFAPDRSAAGDGGPGVALADDGEAAAALATEALIRGPVAARYEGEREFARGGMGAIHRVFDPTLQRHLAKKVLAAHTTRLDAQAAVAERFLDEARVTARLEHPGIVPVHELGVDAAGRPYFTMPLVQGRNLEEVIACVHTARDGWTRARALGVLERVCDAVAFAHSRGVIHRDLKPANVMVGQFGETYVMDWGLARVLGGPDPAAATVADDGADRGAPNGGAAAASADRTDRPPSRTLDGDVVGTPAYMAPEQARGELAAIGPRTDAFAIGAMLYHLLTGRPPYADVGTTTWQELLEATLAGPPTPVRSAGDVPEELAAICERAMARDPAQRYASVQELGDDLRAFLEDRVVRAHRTGAVAELEKWIKRNRLAAAAAGLAFAALAAGLATSVWLKRVADANAAEAVAAKDEAERELGIRSAVLDFLNDDLLAAVAPGRVGKDASMRQVLDAAAERIENRFPDQPLVEAAVRGVLGDTYRRLGVLDEAERHLLRAAALHAEHSAPNAKDGIVTRRILAIVYGMQGRYADAVAVDRELLASSRHTFGPTHEETLTAANNLGLMLIRLGRREEAELILRETLDTRLATLGERHRHTRVSMSNLGLLLYDWGRYAEAKPLIERELHLCLEEDGERDPGTLVSLNNWANLLGGMGQDEEAAQQHARVARISAEVRGERHPETLNSLNNLAGTLIRLQRFDAAREALAEIARRAGPPDPDSRLQLRTDWLAGELQLRTGDPVGAAAALADVVARCRVRLGEGALHTLQATRSWAEALAASGQPDEALRQLHAALAAAGGNPTHCVADLQLLRGRLSTDAGHFADAEADLLAAERFLAANAPEAPLHARTVEALVELYERSRQPEKAAHWRTRGQ